MCKCFGNISQLQTRRFQLTYVSKTWSGPTWIALKIMLEQSQIIYITMQFKITRLHLLGNLIQNWCTLSRYTKYILHTWAIELTFNLMSRAHKFLSIHKLYSKLTFNACFCGVDSVHLWFISAKSGPSNISEQ